MRVNTERDQRQRDRRHRPGQAAQPWKLVTNDSWTFRRSAIERVGDLELRVAHITQPQRLIFHETAFQQALDRPRRVCG